MIGLPEPVAVAPPGDTMTVYEVIVAPPSLPGAVNRTVAWASPGTAVTAVGAPGSPAIGVTAFDGALGAEVPALFVAVTLNV